MNIENELKNIIQELFGTNCPAKHRDISFFSKQIGMSPSELFMLLMECEQRFEVEIPKSLYVDKRIDTFNALKSALELTIKQ